MNQRLPSITARKAISALERAGFIVSRTSGSHCRLVHSGDPARKVTVPMHSGDLRRGTLRGIIAQAGLTVAEFIALATTYRAFNRLFPGAVVLSQVKGWEGAVAVASDDLAGRFVSPEYRTFRCIEGRCLPKYLAAIAPTKSFWGRLKDATRGVGARRERTRPDSFLSSSFLCQLLRTNRRRLAFLIVSARFKPRKPKHPRSWTPCFLQ